jgi:diadenosine tetraphosphate (Ap4A) HIT family hydrolase
MSPDPVQPCIFCRIVHRQAPAHVIWEDEAHLAFLSIYPNTKGFSVVIPKAHHPSYAFDLPDQVLADLTLAARHVGLLLDRALVGVARTVRSKRERNSGKVSVTSLFCLPSRSKTVQNVVEKNG